MRVVPAGSQRRPLTSTNPTVISTGAQRSGEICIAPAHAAGSEDFQPCVGDQRTQHLGCTYSPPCVSLPLGRYFGTGTRYQIGAPRTMRFSPRLIATGLLLLTFSCNAFARPRHASAHSTRRAGSTRRASTRGHHAVAAVHHEAPAGMDTERATAIQSALIKRGYLSGEPTGHWDADSVAAMQKMQSDNGWQTKLTPDSRALIKLGLGPDQVAPAPSTPQPMASN